MAFVFYISGQNNRGGNMTEQRTIFVLGSVDTERLKTQIQLEANFLISYNYQDGLKTALGLHEYRFPIDAIIIALRRSKGKEPTLLENPQKFVSQTITEFGNICPILVVSEVGYQRLPFAGKGLILCHPEALAPTLDQALK